MLFPLHQRIVVRPITDSNEKTSDGGIIIPDDDPHHKAARGEVIATGTGRILPEGNQRACDVKVGDIVLYGEYTGIKVREDGEKLLVMNEDDIIAISACSTPTSSE